jgi:DNA-binding transcriptional ArsR family regulator
MHKVKRSVKICDSPAGRRKTNRLLMLMKEIQQQPDLKPKRLAEKLGVSQRTVYRDLRLLGDNALLTRLNNRQVRRYGLTPKEILFLVKEAAEGGYEAHALGYSIYTQGETLAELEQMVADAVRCHFDEEAMPTVVRLHLVKEESIAI